MRPLDPGHWVFLLAHQDDEVLVAGCIHQLVAAGNRVDLLWLTASPFLAGVLRREAEARGVAHILGVQPEHLHFLNFPSLDLVPQLDLVADRLAAKLDSLKPRQVMSVGFEGGHSDHDCVNFLAHEATHRARLAVPIWEFPLYNGAGGLLRINAFPRGSEVHHQPLTPEAVSRKHLAIQFYASQWPFMLAARLALPRGKLLRQGEPYRQSPPDRDHTLPPHPGTLLIDRPFNRWMHHRFASFARAVALVRAASRPVL